MTGFTPGPWFVEHTALCGLRVVHGEANEDGFRDDITPGAFNPTERGKANAALISAAPTMHAALVTAEDALFAQAVHFQNPDRERVQAALEAVRAALSAARSAPAEAIEGED
jgi:hypothetical protein